MSGLRVALVAACPFPFPRGTPIRVWRMAEALAGAGDEVHVVTYHLGEETAQTPFHVHRIPRVLTYRRTHPGPTYQKLLLIDPLLESALLRVLHRHAIQVIHGHHYEGLVAGLVARRWTRVPVVYDAHTLLGSELRHYPLRLPRGLKDRIGERLDRLLPRRADHVVTVTERIREKLGGKGGVSPDRLSVIPNGIEAAHFREAPAPTSSGDRTGTLVYSGNLASYQGIDLLLRSFRKVLDTKPDVRLLVVTDSAFDPYERLAAHLRVRASLDVVQTGFDGLPQRLAEADVALHPRLDCDGLPMKLLNYMAAGRPVVSFRGSGESLEDGVTGLLIQDGDTDAFAAAAVRLLDEPELARRLGEAGRAWVSAERSWPRVAERVHEVYERVLARRASQPGRDPARLSHAPEGAHAR